ncbi:MAG: hypothetical protein AB1Z21_04840 [Synechococcaceae cyanobacterium]
MTASPTPDADQDPLIEQMRSRRAQLDRFLRGAIPRRRQLVNASILFSSAAALITAAPAFGGQAFTAGLTEALSLSVPSWRLLCGLASASSVVASLTSQLLQTSRLEEKVSRALAARARLEALEQGLLLGQFDRRAATDALLLCIETTALLDPGLERPAGGPDRSR